MKTIDRLVLDTSAYSHLRKGHPQVLARLTDAVRVSVPVVVLGELEAAFERGSRAAENRRVLAELLAEPFVNVLNVTPATVRHYARVFVSLRTAGTPIPLNDVWIAACTLECHGHLLTFDQDYLRVPALECTVLETP
ncbi:MAG: PIN domain-containing protein [Acidobacteriota bacterium]|nr:PIN domain-containing protein [Acidobacteriota bacterium]